MPRYEYFCHACKQLFSQTLTPAEYEESDVVCPRCGSEEVEQRVSAFYTLSHQKRPRNGAEVEKRPGKPQHCSKSSP